MTTKEAIKDFENQNIILQLMNTTGSAETIERNMLAIEALKALEKEPILDKIRAEIEKAVWEDILPISDETGEIVDEIRTPLLDPDDVFEIIDKYKAESEVEENG